MSTASPLVTKRRFTAAADYIYYDSDWDDFVLCAV